MHKTQVLKQLKGENTLVSFIENPSGCEFPIHSHVSEQILIILEGQEDHVCGDETFLMKAGDVCVHPPNESGGRTSVYKLPGGVSPFLICVVEFGDLQELPGHPSVFQFSKGGIDSKAA